MRRFTPTTRKKSRIEIIPMIDVMMFLLVFFVLISINVMPALGLKLKLPVSAQAQQSQQAERVQVGIPPRGPLLLDGQPVADLEQLGAQLLRRKQAAPEGIAVIVSGDESTPLQRLVDVMDALQSRGIEGLTISAKRK